MDHFATLVNGKKVYVDLVASHAATHFADTPELVQVVKDFLSKQSFTEPEVYRDYDTGEIIGASDLVETEANDEVVYAKRLNRETYTRFVKNKKGIPTSYVTVSLRQSATGDYELLSAWPGQICPPFPDDPRATSESKSFWSKYALVWGKQMVLEGTETEIAPWN